MNGHVRTALISLAVRAMQPARSLVLRYPAVSRLALGSGLPLENALWRAGEWRLVQAAKAAHQAPAYRSLLASHPGASVTFDGLAPDFSNLPVMDKESYVKRFSVEERCRGGKLPDRGVTIDESSGTSGTPNNWVRGIEERADMRLMLQSSGRVLLGDEPIFVINAFALGPWATGMTISMSLADAAVVKSTGPDIAKIENTLKLFGPRYRYLLCGYPPFLKRLVDQADIDWKQYSILAFCGGEGMSEGLRAYLEQRISRVYSSFGASDLEINIAAESEFTVALRRKLIEDPSLGKALGLPDSATPPMIFQFNPMDYFIETNDEGELIISIVRARTIAPKIRYNIHDSGRVIRYGELVKVLKSRGMNPGDLAKTPFPLPLMFHYGRSDATVAFYGCKITPADLEEVVFTMPELGRRVDSFALLEGEDRDANKTLAFAFELATNADAPVDDGSLRDRVLDRLVAVNQDYRESSRYMNPDFRPTIEFHEHATGPFANYDIRLKHHYIQQR